MEIIILAAIVITPLSYSIWILGRLFYSTYLKNVGRPISILGQFLISFAFAMVMYQIINWDSITDFINGFKMKNLQNIYYICRYFLLPLVFSLSFYYGFDSIHELKLKNN